MSVGEVLSLVGTPTGIAVCLVALVHEWRLHRRSESEYALRRHVFDFTLDKSVLEDLPKMRRAERRLVYRRSR